MGGGAGGRTDPTATIGTKIAKIANSQIANSQIANSQIANPQHPKTIKESFSYYPFVHARPKYDFAEPVRSQPLTKRSRWPLSIPKVHASPAFGCRADRNRTYPPAQSAGPGGPPTSQEKCESKAPSVSAGWQPENSIFREAALKSTKVPKPALKVPKGDLMPLTKVSPPGPRADYPKAKSTKVPNGALIVPTSQW